MHVVGGMRYVSIRWVIRLKNVPKLSLNDSTTISYLRVSRDCCVSSGEEISPIISVFLCQEASLSDIDPLMLLLNHSSSEQHLTLLKGAPLDKDTIP